ncbi:MAG: aminopeptidase [Clostridia bacterium]|nr:aminopeptidase [Clostridia bacterium]
MDKELTYKNPNGLTDMTVEEKANMESYVKGYKDFLNKGKTERLCVKEAIKIAENAGFKELKEGMKLKAGDKVYENNRGKMLLLAVIGEEDLNKGVNISASHIDSPRLDLKPEPLYEDSDLAYLKTHYYGGIRKYQWVTIPLALYGVVALKDGRVIDVAIGEGDETKLVISDLLPHLGQEQNKKPLATGIEAEQLNLLVGSGEESKKKVLQLLYEKYGFEEEDLISAELEAVPAVMATDIGIDSTMIGSYGHDDRVCSYAALKAITEVNMPKKTAICILADKEEIGSEGVTGMKTQAFETFIEELGADVRKCFKNSFCISADVTAAYDPNFADAFEKRNEAHLNHGICLCKYTGARGKSGASDASAETVAYVRRKFEEGNVHWQIADMGKVDLGGGGTVALDLAYRNIETIDAGVPVLSMHAPFEVVAKYDCYMTYLAMKAILG